MCGGDTWRAGNGKNGDVSTPARVKVKPGRHCRRPETLQASGRKISSPLSRAPASQPAMGGFGDEGWGSPEMVGEYTGYAMHNSVVVVFRCGWLACGAWGRFCCLPFGVSDLSRDRERSRVNVPAFQVPAMICPGFLESFCSRFGVCFAGFFRH